MSRLSPVKEFVSVTPSRTRNGLCRVVGLLSTDVDLTHLLDFSLDYGLIQHALLSKTCNLLNLYSLKIPNIAFIPFLKVWSNGTFDLQIHGSPNRAKEVATEFFMYLDNEIVIGCQK
jgi:hypothetical protein